MIENAIASARVRLFARVGGAPLLLRLPTGWRRLVQAMQRRPVLLLESDSAALCCCMAISYVQVDWGGDGQPESSMRCGPTGDDRAGCQGLGSP